MRFAELKRRIIISEEQGSNFIHAYLLGKIQSRVKLKSRPEFDGLYNELLLKMARNQIFSINERQLSVNQQSYCANYLVDHLCQHITPDSH